MRKIAVTSLLLGLVCTGALMAQTEVHNFIISVWPEYDHPGVLVIFNGEIDSSALPQEVHFPIPERSRFALVAGSTDTTANTLIRIPIEDTDDGKQIRFRVGHPSFHVEFYFNPFNPNNPHRHYAYDFVSSHPIDSLIVDLQQPLAAQQFSPEMPVDHEMQDSHGIRYHRAHFANISPGDTVHIEAHYENPENRMTNQIMQEQMGNQQDGTMRRSAPSTEKGGNKSFWVLLVVILIIVGTVFFLLRGKSPETPREESIASPEQADSGVHQSLENGTGEGNVKYCIYCGASIPKTAKFCTKCGKSQAD